MGDLKSRGLPQTENYTAAVGTCDTGGSCPYPGQCDESSKRCVRAGLVARLGNSCGCAVPGIDEGERWVILAAIGAIFAGYARRRARGGRAV
jgi:hypothetical protein